ncbi:MAG TPA: hemolysin family protein, partial [Ktedonobacterales bacterium]
GIRLHEQADEGDASAARVVRLLDRYGRDDIITAILAVSNISVIVTTTLTTILAVDSGLPFAEAIATILLTIFVLIFCEIAPKSAAVNNADEVAKRLSIPIETFMLLMRPALWVLVPIADFLIRVLGWEPSHKHPVVTEGEIRRLVEAGEEAGQIEEDAGEMVSNVFDLSRTLVREVMVPRRDMVAVEADTPLNEAVQMMLDGGKSRVPMYDEEHADIIGLLYAKDLLRVFATGQHPESLRELLRPAHFIPETQKVDDLLTEMQRDKFHMAIVTDEYGDVAGLVTIEDLVEEIVGDIQDEYDSEDQLFERISDTEYIMDARILIGDFNEEMRVELPAGEYDTLGGFIVEQLGRIPKGGDVVHFQDLEFTVLGTIRRRITKVRVVRSVAIVPVESPADGDPEARENGRSAASIPGAPVTKGNGK